MKIKSTLVIFLFLALSHFTFAQVTFEAKVSKTKLGINERLRIDFKMNTDGDNFTPPSFKDFTVAGGPNTSVSNSWINGTRSFSKTYSYFLTPKKQGKLKINQATIEIQGEIYKTQTVTVTVGAAVKRPNDPDNAVNVAEDNIHLVAEVSKTNPYLNEAVTVVYKLYVSATTGVSNWREIGSPKYSDFWSQNIELKGIKIENGKYKGEDYRYVVLRKTVLYPQKSGKLEIEPLSLDVTVDVPSKRRDIFGGRLMTSVHRTVSAGSLNIQVKPLPEATKPSNFTGAVGHFNFKVSASKQALNANESLQIKAEVIGNGNLKLFNLPELTVPSSLEIYEPEHQEKVSTNLSGMRGSISDSYIVVPQYKGKYPIPDISFSYFDLKTETYKQLTSDELVIDVIEGPTNAADTVVNSDAATQVGSPNDQFAFIKTETHLTPTITSHFFKTTGFWSGLLLPLLAIPLAIVFRREKEKRAADIFGNKIRKADKLAKKYLGEAKRNLEDKDRFYVALEKALHNYLKATLQIETSEFTKDKIESLLISKSVEVAVVSRFLELLENCELARYTPITNVKMQQDYDKSAKTISLIDKQIR